MGRRGGAGRRRGAAGGDSILLVPPPSPVGGGHRDGVAAGAAALGGSDANATHKLEKEREVPDRGERQNNSLKVSGPHCPCGSELVLPHRRVPRCIDQDLNEGGVREMLG